MTQEVAFPVRKSRIPIYSYVECGRRPPPTELTLRHIVNLLSLCNLLPRLTLQEVLFVGQEGQSEVAGRGHTGVGLSGNHYQLTLAFA